MPNPQITAGNWRVWTVNVTNPDGSADTTTPVTTRSTPTGKVTIDPVSPAAGNRQFYVTGVAAALGVTLIATDSRSHEVFEHVDVLLPDLSGISSGGFGPEQPGPHP